MPVPYSDPPVLIGNWAYFSLADDGGARSDVDEQPGRRDAVAAFYRAQRVLAQLRRGAGQRRQPPRTLRERPHPARHGQAGRPPHFHARKRHAQLTLYHFLSFVLTLVA